MGREEWENSLSEEWLYWAWFTYTCFWKQTEYWSVYPVLYQESINLRSTDEASGDVKNSQLIGPLRLNGFMWPVLKAKISGYNLKMPEIERA